MRKFSQTIEYIDNKGTVHVRGYSKKRYPLNMIKFNGNVANINIGDTAIVEQRASTTPPYVHYLLVDVIKQNNVPEIEKVVEI